MSSHTHNGQPETGINNDNGNTELPSIALVNNDSNDAFVGGGTILGEVSLPNKFLSAKNSIEIHKNKVLTTNQSMPNVIQDRNHCLNNLISPNHGHSSVQPFLRTFLLPFSKPERSSNHDHDYSHIRHAGGQKSTKTVNWAPVPEPGQNEESLLKQMASPRTSNTNIHIVLGSESAAHGPCPQEYTLNESGTPALNLRETNYMKRPGSDGAGSDNDCKIHQPSKLSHRHEDNNMIKSQSTDKESSPIDVDLKFQPFMLYNHVGKPPSQTPSDEDVQFTVIPRPVDLNDLSRASLTLTDRSMIQGNEEFSQNSPSIYKQLFYHKEAIPDGDNVSINDNDTDTDDGLTLTLPVHPNAPRQFQLGAENVHADTDVINGKKTSRELQSDRQQLLLSSHSNTQVNYRDQNTGSDMATLTTTDNNLENHNYDTDDELCEPNPQTNVLTMVNPNDLPVPDPDYVARMVPPEFHPFIAKKCKKDCRTWLWKSRSQRESCLAKQKSEQERDREKQTSMDNKKS